MKKHTKILPKEYIESKLESLKSNHYSTIFISDKEFCLDILESHLILSKKMEAIVDLCEDTPLNLGRGFYVWSAEIQKEINK